MNPFDWPGRQFLPFYLLFAGAVLAYQWWRNQSSESQFAEPYDLGDPYLVAYLRGAEPAVVRQVGQIIV